MIVNNFSIFCFTTKCYRCLDQPGLPQKRDCCITVGFNACMMRDSRQKRGIFSSCCYKAENFQRTDQKLTEASFVISQIIAEKKKAHNSAESVI